MLGMVSECTSYPVFSRRLPSSSALPESWMWAWCVLTGPEHVPQASMWVGTLAWPVHLLPGRQPCGLHLEGRTHFIWKEKDIESFLVISLTEMSESGSGPRCQSIKLTWAHTESLHRLQIESRTVFTYSQHLSFSSSPFYIFLILYEENK